MANTLSVMNALRNVVSKNRIRYVDNGFDLDLAYIYDNIIAMGYPAEKIEGCYRNRFEDVYQFFEKNHQNHYKVYNLCSERSYDMNKFHGRTAVYPFADHNPPTIELILNFCDDVDRWLKADSKNVVAIHCKAGKGRTGTMICCYLVYCGLKPTADEALAYYGQKRAIDRKGVTIPSQRRYVQYFSKLIGSKQRYERRTLQICEIRFSCQPLMLSQGTATCTISALSDSSTSKEEQTLYTGPIDFRKTLSIEIKDRCLLLTGDIKIEMHQRMLPKKLFHFWFNTFFIPEIAEIEGEGDEAKMIYDLSKNELDDAHKDKEHKNYAKDFNVKLVLQNIPPKSYMSGKNSAIIRNNHFAKTNNAAGIVNRIPNHRQTIHETQSSQQPHLHQQNSNSNSNHILTNAICLSNSVGTKYVGSDISDTNNCTPLADRNIYAEIKRKSQPPPQTSLQYPSIQKNHHNNSIYHYNNVNSSSKQQQQQHQQQQQQQHAQQINKVTVTPPSVSPEINRTNSNNSNTSTSSSSGSINSQSSSAVGEDWESGECSSTTNSTTTTPYYFQQNSNMLDKTNKIAFRKNSSPSSVTMMMMTMADDNNYDNNEITMVTPPPPPLPLMPPPQLLKTHRPISSSVSFSNTRTDDHKNLIKLSNSSSCSFSSKKYANLNVNNKTIINDDEDINIANNNKFDNLIRCSNSININDPSSSSSLTSTSRISSCNSSSSTSSTSPPAVVLTVATFPTKKSIIANNKYELTSNKNNSNSCSSSTAKSYCAKTGNKFLNLIAPKFDGRKKFKVKNFNSINTISSSSGGIGGSCIGTSFSCGNENIIDNNKLNRNNDGVSITNISNIDSSNYCSKSQNIAKKKNFKKFPWFQNYFKTDPEFRMNLVKSAKFRNNSFKSNCSNNTRTSTSTLTSTSKQNLPDTISVDSDLLLPTVIKNKKRTISGTTIVDHDYYSSLCDKQLSFNNSPCKSPRSLSEVIGKWTDDDSRGKNLKRTNSDLGSISSNSISNDKPLIALANEIDTNVIVVAAKPIQSHSQSIGFNVLKTFDNAININVVDDAGPPSNSTNLIASEKPIMIMDHHRNQLLKRSISIDNNKMKISTTIPTSTPIITPITTNNITKITTTNTTTTTTTTTMTIPTATTAATATSTSTIAAAATATQRCVPFSFESIRQELQSVLQTSTMNKFKTKRSSSLNLILGNNNCSNSYSVKLNLSNDNNNKGCSTSSSSSPISNFNSNTSSSNNFQNIEIINPSTTTNTSESDQNIVNNPINSSTSTSTLTATTATATPINSTTSNATNSDCSNKAYSFVKIKKLSLPLPETNNSYKNINISDSNNTTLSSDNSLQSFDSS